MKNVSKTLVFALFVAGMITFNGCKKDAGIPTPELPALATSPVVNITTTYAETGGKLTSTGSSGLTACGVCWSTSHSPTIADTKTTNGAGSGTFTSDIDGLTANTTYYVRAYATNSAGTAYGNEISFTSTQVSLAVLTTMEVTNITVASAVSGWNITYNGGEDVTETGVCWGTASNPTTSNNKASDGFINGLTPSTKYYVRAYAINSYGTAYGDELSFTTSAISPIIFNDDLTYGSVSDIDGNIYKIIQIGTQLWMAENLKTTKYNNGTTIPNVTDNKEWRNLTTPGYSWYNNDASSYKNNYGALYNWYAVSTGKLCPTGWHVPTFFEWSTLATYPGSEDVSGYKMKETGITHWLSPNDGATNETGFTGLPGGGRWSASGSVNPDKQFVNIGYQGSWWSATSSDPSYLGADYFLIGWNGPNILNAWQASLDNGLSVRCIKDN